MNNTKKMVSIGKAADMLGVCLDTLREWDKEDKLVSVKTPGNHRRYLVSDIEKFQGIVVKEDQAKTETNIPVAAYSRVSSHEQKTKGDLERQNGRLLAYCVKKGYNVVKSYEEVGSGMSDTRPRLRQMFKLIEEKQVKKVVVEHKDRLTRFNFQFLSDYFASHGVEIEWTEEVLGKKRYEDELVEEMLTLMSSFSNKIYGKRSAENRKKKKQELQELQAAGASQC